MQWFSSIRSGWHATNGDMRKPLLLLPKFLLQWKERQKIITELGNAKSFSPQAVHQPFYHRCYRAHFDAAICPDKSAAAVVIFGPDRNIISACTSILPSMTPLCAVAEALLLSVDQVKHLEISEILLEGANSEIIDALSPQISKVICELDNWSDHSTGLWAFSWSPFLDCCPP